MAMVTSSILRMVDLDLRDKRVLIR